MKKQKFKHHTRLLFGILAVLYPVLVFCALVVFNLPIRYLSIGIIVFAIAYSIVNSRHYRGKHSAALFVSPLILCAIGGVSLFMDSPLVLKLYPALADFAYVTILTTSFFIPPPFAFYFIDIFDRSIKNKIPRQRFDRYCFKATLVWVVFFIIDGIIAVCTVFWASNIIWGIYNGAVTYIIMALIFAGEFVIIKTIEKKQCMEKNDSEGTYVNS
jgi:uncharacterized membrane protein